jgi:hypothetical protein
LINLRRNNELLGRERKGKPAIFTNRFNDAPENMPDLGVRRLKVLYESTDANVTLVPLARAGLAGRIVAWLELFFLIAGFK